MQMRIGAPSFAIEPRQAFVRVSTSLFATVATEAQLLIYQKDVCRLAQTFIDEELRGF